MRRRKIKITIFVEIYRIKTTIFVIMNKEIYLNNWKGGIEKCCSKGRFMRGSGS